MTTPFTTIRSLVAPLGADDVDTDQIIPARFLKRIDKTGLAEGLFAEWRKDPAFVLHRPALRGAEILLAGRNFGCGSSREHAPWALVGGGFRCVIASSFADIFASNAQKNGLLPVALGREHHAELTRAIEREPGLMVEVDLPAQRVRFGGREAPFEVEPLAKDFLLRGVDELGYLLGYADAIAAFERARAEPVA